MERKRCAMRTFCVHVKTVIAPLKAAQASWSAWRNLKSHVQMGANARHLAFVHPAPVALTTLNALQGSASAHPALATRTWEVAAWAVR
mmetsp:Transcript_47546/g.87377  ORF Transcript_47546/g.87377 Transcript_47546/m.87377 type:complete len:88 (-) Transcript_47546:209-472(-)